MKELYVTAYELACITGRPLPEILRGLKNGTIKTEEGHNRPPYMGDTGFTIPLSQLYPKSWEKL